MVVVHFLAEHQVKLWVHVVRLIELRSENDHNPVLQEVVEVNGIRVETLTFEVVRFLFTHLDLETDNITVLDLTLRERRFRLH